MLKWPKNQTWYLLFSVLVFCVLFLRHAWVAEDAYITFRTIDNFVHGYGLRWNIAERVQSFTHPLWMLLLTPFYALYQNIYLWALVVSFALSLAAFVLLVKSAAGEVWRLLVVCLALFASKSFMDYTSSGLENPLSFFLTYMTFSTFFSRPCSSQQRHFFWLCLWASLAAVNRQDLILLALPMIAYEGYNTAKRTSLATAIGALCLAFLPLCLWLVFSIVYYGFPFPNTYYAKLYTGLPKLEVLGQGLIYYLDSLGRDPVTLPMIGLVFLVSLLQVRARIAALGIALYLLYIVDIGGDFMSGRFFSVPFVAALTVFAYIPLRPRFQAVLPFVALVLALFAAANPFSPFSASRDYENTEIPSSGVADERGWYFQHMGLLRVNLARFPQHPWRNLGEQWRSNHVSLIQFSNIGIAGYYAGPETHILDGYALTDPFLSRQPTVRSADGRWRIGHFLRQIPNEYIESLQAGTNTFTDPGMRDAYDDIYLITRGPLFSRDRWVAIARRNMP